MIDLNKNEQNKKIAILVVLIVIFLLAYLGLSYLITKNQNKNDVVDTSGNVRTTNDGIIDSKNLSPTTVSVESQNASLPADQIAKLQKSADDLAKIDDENYQNYPWLDELPISSDKYFVYFNLNEKKFIVKFYVTGDDDNIMNEVFSQLTNIGVQTSDFVFEKKYSTPK